MAFGKKKKEKAEEPKSALDDASSDELFIVDQVRKVQVDRLRPDDNEGVDLSPEGLDRVEESRPRHR